MINELLVVFLTAQTVMIPILGGIWLGIRAERQRQARLFQLATVQLAQRSRGGFPPQRKNFEVNT